MQRADLDAILNLEVPIIVEIGRRELPMEMVLALAPGSIIELPKNADEELELLVNNKPIGSGDAVKVGENFGIKLSFIGDVGQRLEAMRGQAPSEEDAVSDAEAEAMADDLLGES